MLSNLKKNNHPKLPNFIIGGATASGTSFLTHILMQHDDIYLPKELDKEPHFFSMTARYEKGINHYQENWFSDWNSQQAIGERSSSYFHFPEAAIRLKEHLPSTKFIFVVRDPTERAFAQYRYMVLRGLEELDFKTALIEEKNRFDPAKRHHEYAGRSLYGKQLESFLKSFPLNQMLFISSEKLRQETDKQLRRITNFLGVSPLDHYRVDSEFPSMSVKDQQIQIKAREHFGKSFKYIIEAIRFKKQHLNSYIETELDRYYLLKIMDNLCEEKELLSEEIRKNLDDYFKVDQEKFFDLARDVIDFKSWTS